MINQNAQKNPEVKEEKLEQVTGGYSVPIPPSSSFPKNPGLTASGTRLDISDSDIANEHS